MSMNVVRRAVVVVSTLVAVGASGMGSASAAPQVPKATPFTDVIPADVCGFEIPASVSDAQRAHGNGGHIVVSGPVRVELSATVNGLRHTMKINASGPGHIGQAGGLDVLTGPAIFATTLANGDTALVLTRGRVVLDANGTIVSRSGRLINLCTSLA